MVKGNKELSWRYRPSTCNTVVVVYTKAQTPVVITCVSHQTKHPLLYRIIIELHVYRVGRVTHVVSLRYSRLAQEFRIHTVYNVNNLYFETDLSPQVWRATGSSWRPPWPRWVSVWVSLGGVPLVASAPDPATRGSTSEHPLLASRITLAPGHVMCYRFIDTCTETFRVPQVKFPIENCYFEI